MPEGCTHTEPSLRLQASRCENDERKGGVLCPHTGRLGRVESDVAAIAGTVQEWKIRDTVSSDVSSQSERLNDTRLVVEQKANEGQEGGRGNETVSGNELENKTMTRCVNILKEWTGKATATIIFDSTVDEFTDGCFFTMVKGKPNVAIVATTTDGDVFGGFYSVAVTERFEKFYDSNMFAFSFESHGRCETPQRFVAKEGLKDYAFVRFESNNKSGFVLFEVKGAGWFFLGNEKSESWCSHLSLGFEDIEDTTLTGKDGTWRGPYHHCTRLVVVQLE